MGQSPRVLLALILCSCAIPRNQIRTRDRVRIDGNEMPGIGATKDKPDTVLAYYDKADQATHITYLH